MLVIFNINDFVIRYYTIGFPQTGRGIHVTGQYGCGSQDIQDVPKEGLTQTSPSPQVQNDGRFG